MKRILSSGIFVLAGILVLSAVVVLAGDGTVGTITEVKSDNASKTFASHATIYINGNINFTSANGVTSGSGTQSNPYIIENYDIDASTAMGDEWERAGIKIKNTDAYFIIRNCIVRDGRANYNYGIYFYTVTNGKIDNLTSYNNCAGILLGESSNNNQITDCDVYNNSRHGIELYYSSNYNQITNCAVYNNSWKGIWLDHSSNNNITNCAVYNNSQHGIELAPSSNNNQITNCNIYNNYCGGIWQDISSNNKIHYSNIYNNANYGVYNCNSEYQYVVRATYNWWGSASGPYHSATNPNGTGNSVSDNVIYLSWLTAPVDTEAPQIINVLAIPATQAQGGYVNITCTVTDNFAVDTVKVDITGPDGFTLVNTTMARISGTNNYYHNATYSVPGIYSYYIWAKDMSDNENTSAKYHLTIKTAPTPINWLLYIGIIATVIIIVIVVFAIVRLRKKQQ